MQEPASPYQQSSSQFYWDERENAMLLWLRRFQDIGVNLSGSTSYLKRIRDIQPSIFFDCICLVGLVPHTGISVLDQLSSLSPAVTRKDAAVQVPSCGKSIAIIRHSSCAGAGCANERQ